MHTSPAQAICVIVEPTEVSTRFTPPSVEYLPREPVFHFSGKDIRVSADASLGSSPAETVDMVVVSKRCAVRFGVTVLDLEWQKLCGGHVLCA